MINEILLYSEAQISKNAFNYKIIYINKIEYIAQDYRNNEDNIKSNIEYRIYKRLNSELIDFKQIF